jgi:hypothetical protein
LLHFETTSKYYETCDKVIAQLKKHEQFSGYEKTEKFYKKQNNDIYVRLKPHLLKAIENANKLKAFDLENTQSGMSEMQLFFETKEYKHK